MRNLRRLVILAAPLAVLAAGCGGGPKLGPDDVAKVGGVLITRAQFDQLMNRAKESYARQHQQFPKQTSPQYAQLKSQAMQVLVQKAEFAQEAKDMGVTISQKQIDDRIKQYVAQYYGGSQKKFAAQLKQLGVSKAEVDQDVKAQLTQEALYNKVTGKVNVTPQGVQKYYNQHKQQYQVAQSRTVRHILVKKKALAETLYRHLKSDNGKDFASLAKRYSKDPSSASQGGKLTITKGQTVMQFDTTAFTLGKGTISVPIHTQYGWHIIQPLSAIRPAKTTPFKQVAPAIRQQLLQQKKNETMTNWVNGLTKKFNPQYQPGYKPQAAATPTPTTTGP